MSAPKHTTETNDRSETIDSISTEQTLLSKDTLSYEQELQNIKKQVGVFKGVSDGFLFGKFGLDAILGLIPFVGGTYTLGGGLWLLLKARQAKCSTFTQIYTLILIAIDTVIGMVLGIGDVADIFFRSHAWASDRIHDEVCNKLDEINEERSKLSLIAQPNNRETEFKGLFENQGWLKWLGITLIAAGCVYFLMSYYNVI